jgi:rare lipoprotein A
MVPPQNLGVVLGMRAIPSWPLLVLALAGCVQQQPPEQATQAPGSAPISGPDTCSQVGMASWYRGSSRNRASPQELVAAHPSLPFGTAVQVTLIDTGQSIVVRINDRGPFGRGRIIDLSRAAADQLGMRRDGVARVLVQPVAWSGGGCPLAHAQMD